MAIGDVNDSSLPRRGQRARSARRCGCLDEMSRLSTLYARAKPSVARVEWPAGTKAARFDVQQMVRRVGAGRVGLGKTFSMDGQLFYALRVRVPNSVGEKMMRVPSLDGIGPARSAEGRVLDLINQHGKIDVLSANAGP